MQMGSRAVDRICYQPLYAKSRTDTAWVRPQPNGNLIIRVSQFPLSSVTTAQWRASSADSWHIVPSANITINGQRSYIIDNQSYAVWASSAYEKLTVQTTYAHGFANAKLTQDAAVGATTLYLDDTTGIDADDTITIYDGASQEDVTVSAVGASNVTLSTGTVFAHSTGVRVSKLPLEITLACINLVTYLIKQRQSGGSVTMKGEIDLEDMNSGDMQSARWLLRPYIKVMP